jgi:hypothetical protein
LQGNAVETFRVLEERVVAPQADVVDDAAYVLVDAAAPRRGRGLRARDVDGRQLVAAVYQLEHGARE